MRIFFLSKIKLDELAFEIKRYKKEIEEELKCLNKVKQWIKNYSREKKLREHAFYWNLIVKKEYKSIAAFLYLLVKCIKF